MPTTRSALAALCVALLAPGLARPQTPEPTAGTTAATAAAPIGVFLLTMGQGDPYWTRFGHNALRIVDHGRGTDISYNWGLFDFDEPGFLGRFVRGDTRYWMAGFDTEEMLAVYRYENRSIEMQELAISPDAARALRDFVEWNALPENRAYRYDYYRDNCSTRIRDALDRALGGQIRSATDTIVTATTYRWHTSRLLAGHAPTYVGTMLALGKPTDRPITAWEEMFIPMQLRDRIRQVQVSDGGGGTVPLVRNETRLFNATRAPERSTPPRGTLYATLAGLAGATVIAGLAWIAVRRRNRAARWGAGALATIWSAFAGIAGAATVGLWAFTEHVSTYGNENVLQATPLSLALAVLLPLTVRREPHSRASRGASVLSLAIVALAGIGFIAQLLPAMYQENGQVIGVALPMHAALAYAVWLFRRTGE